MTTLPTRHLFTACSAGLCSGALLLAAASGVQAQGAAENDGSQPKQAVAKPDNKLLYGADGGLNEAAVKQAYFQMMRAFDYPVSSLLKTDQFWVCDFLQRDIKSVGMGGIFWINAHNSYKQAGTKAYGGDFKEGKYGYLGSEIYLLPGQMLPEHRHIGGADGYGPKMEAWHIRYGNVEFFGQHKGAGDETLISDMPAAERPFGYGQPWFRSKYVAKRSAGELYSLEDPESWHFQRAGTNGAIVSEYATYHNQVEFSKPGMLFECSKATAAK